MVNEEVKVFFEVSDVKRVWVECGRCKGKVPFPLAGSRSVPETCPICEKPWVGNDKDCYEKEIVELNKFLVAMRRFEERETRQLQITFELEIESGGLCRYIVPAFLPASA